MSSVNKATIVGNLGKDPEVRTFDNGGKVCNFPVATSMRWKDRNTGEKREVTHWHTIVIFSEGIIGVAEQYLRKGSKVYLEGQIETRKWQDQSGQDRYTTEIVLRPYSGTLVLLGDGGGSGRTAGQEESYRNGPQEAPSGSPDDRAPPPEYSGGMEDEIPF